MSKRVLLISGLTILGAIILGFVIVHFIPLSADNLWESPYGIEVCRATIDSNGTTYSQPNCPSEISVCTPPQAEMIGKVTSCEVQANDEKGNPGTVVCTTNPFIIFYLPPPPKYLSLLSVPRAKAADVLYTCSWFIKYPNLNNSSLAPSNNGVNQPQEDNNTPSGSNPTSTQPDNNNGSNESDNNVTDDEETDKNDTSNDEVNPPQNDNTLPVQLAPPTGSCTLKSEPSTTEGAYHITLIADKTATSAAKLIQCALLQQIEPFSQMGDQLAIDVVTAEEKDMNCRRQDPAHPTSITCDYSFLRSEGAKQNAHLTAAVTSAVTGGTAQGGLIMVSSLEEDRLVGTMVHEIGHAVANLGDEYEFKTEAQKAAFCQPPRNRPNIISFTPKASYKSDIEARETHQSSIPWFSLIKEKTPITTGRELGTNGADNIVDPANLPFGLAGLFKSGGCNGVGIASWRPYGVPNFMVGPKDTTIPPYHSDLLVKAMGATRGKEITLK